MDCRYKEALDAYNKIDDGDGLLEWIDEYQFVMLRALRRVHELDKMMEDK